MGEAKRRQTSTQRIELRVFEPPPDDAGLLIPGSVLQNLADKLAAQLFIKEPDDGLLEWPLGSVIGMAAQTERARECPYIAEFRERADEDSWEFLLPERLLIDGYAMDVMVRGIELPGPIPSDEFMSHVRRFFQAQAPLRRRHWTGIAPRAWAQALVAHDGAPN